MPYRSLALWTYRILLSVWSPNVPAVLSLPPMVITAASSASRRGALLLDQLRAAWRPVYCRRGRCHPPWANVGASRFRRHRVISGISAGFDETRAVGPVPAALPGAPLRSVLWSRRILPGGGSWNGFRWGCEGAVEQFGRISPSPARKLAGGWCRLTSREAEGLAFRIQGAIQMWSRCLLAAWPPARRARPQRLRRHLGRWHLARSCTRCDWPQVCR